MVPHAGLETIWQKGKKENYTCKKKRGMEIFTFFPKIIIAVLH